MAHELYKCLENKDMRGMLDGLSSHCRTALLHHQLVSLVWGLDAERKRVMLWHDIGTGKTLIALCLSLLWNARRVLVVCPKSVMPTWRAEIDKHLKDNEVCVLTGSAAKRRALVVDDNTRFQLINYEGLKYAFGERKQGGFLPDYNVLLDSPYDCVVFDECHHLASHMALQTKIAARLSQLATYTIGLTGTPITSDAQSLWSQYAVLDQGRCLGPSFYKFRAKYFIQPRFGYTWKPKRGAIDDIMSRIEFPTLRYSADECVDLPELVFSRRVVEPTEKIQDLYQATEDGLLLDLPDGDFDTSVVVNRAIKLLQITSGFLIVGDGKTETIPGKNPKLEELRGILRSTALLGQKVLVCHTFQMEGRMIEVLCRRMNVPYAAMRGEVPDKAKQAGYEGFISDGEPNVLVFHPASAGEGLNLQCARHIVFFSHRIGSVARRQAIGRIHRQGQPDSCVVFDLITKGTLEEGLVTRLEKKMEFSEAVLESLGISKARRVEK